MPPTDSAQTMNVINVTADVTLNRGQMPCHITNLGATGTVVVTLPQDAKGGEMFTAKVLVAQAIQISPGAAGAFWARGTSTFAKQAVYPAVFQFKVQLIENDFLCKRFLYIFK